MFTTTRVIYGSCLYSASRPILLTLSCDLSMWVYFVEMSILPVLILVEYIFFSNAFTIYVMKTLSTFKEQIKVMSFAPISHCVFPVFALQRCCYFNLDLDQSLK